MSGFLSYAQNFEDLMLWRALRRVGHGFYIDVGAADPDEDSVTRAFYDHGWRGINVEPSPEHFEALLAARPRDITLRCLVGATSGAANLHHFADTGLSTTSDTFAQRHVADGRDDDVLSVPMLSLAEICQRHAPGDIHFLKIDVEGAEAEVLRGADFAAFRPWIVLAEATEPGSQTENWYGWDGLLTAADYRFVWFDGLNRFYIAAEHWDALRPAFAAPPNVFDQWSKPLSKAQRAELERLQAEAAGLHFQLTESRQAAVTAEREAADARWRATVLQTEAAANRLQLATVQAASATARAEADRLQAALGLVRTELDRLHAERRAERAEMERLGNDLVGQKLAHEQTAAALAAVYGSRSWRMGAPVRRLGGFLRTRSIVRHVKRVARGAFYRLLRAAAGAPGSRKASAMMRRLLPRLHAALYARYQSQRDLLVNATPVESGGAQVSPERPAELELAAQPVTSAEESRMLLRLRAQTRAR